MYVYSLSKDKYFMDIQDEKRSRIYNNYAEWEKYQKTGVATFGLPQKKEGKLNNDEKTNDTNDYARTRLEHFFLIYVCKVCTNFDKLCTC
jgi:hypothetical protein